jgi:dihydroxyacetone kinase
MSSCQLPGTEKPIFEIGEDDMELGMGIHGEPGIERTTMMCSEELAKTIFVRLSSDLGLTPGERVAVLVNGLGGTSREELYVLYKDLYKELEDHDIAVQKVYVGEYATSLEMQGASVSLLRLDEELKELLAEPACSPFIRE